VLSQNKQNRDSGYLSFAGNPKGITEGNPPDLLTSARFTSPQPSPPDPGFSPAT